MFTYTPTPFQDWSHAMTKDLIPIKEEVTISPLSFTVPQIAVKQLQLLSHQVKWANRVEQILQNNYGYIDTSKMRSGKTYVVLHIALKFNFRILVICPPIVINVWKQTARQYGVEIIDAISFQTLRSKQGFEVKHGFLNRIEKYINGEMDVSFVPTDKYLTLVQEGILVIFDEIQFIKKDSAQYRACKALVDPITSNGGLSRFGLVSGLPLDKDEHIIFLLRILGYIRSPKLYRKVDNKLILEGLQELADICASMDYQTTAKIFEETPVAKGTAVSICHQLYINIIKPRISGAMTPPSAVGEERFMNGYFIMSPEKAQELSEALSALANAIMYNPDSGVSGTINRNNIGLVTIALKGIELAKAELFARLAREDLMKHPTDKVVICINYKQEIIPKLLDLLRDFSPIILNGDSSQKQKEQVAKQFREDPNARLLLLNAAAGGVGISLYSTLPNRDIRMYVSPSYKLLEIAQVVARIRGPGMISNTYVTMVYGKGDAVVESGILRSLVRKSEVAKSMLEEEVIEGTIFPDEYETYVEEPGVPRP